MYDDGQQPGQLPAPGVEVKDTAAAGDIFHGAFAFALLQQMPLRQALRFATSAAGLSVQKFGARTSTPDLFQVREALENELKD
jgi:ribokinase